MSDHFFTKTSQVAVTRVKMLSSNPYFLVSASAIFCIILISVLSQKDLKRPQFVAKVVVIRFKHAYKQILASVSGMCLSASALSCLCVLAACLWLAELILSSRSAPSFETREKLQEDDTREAIFFYVTSHSSQDPLPELGLKTLRYVTQL